MPVGSSGTTLTSEDLAELRIQAMYHIKKAEQIFSKIGDIRKNTNVMVLAEQTKAISLHVQHILDSAKEKT